MGSFLYYVHDVGLMTDVLFDELSRFLLSRPDIVSAHHHGHLVNPERLAAGTGFDIKAEEYPPMCRDAAILLNNQLQLGPALEWPSCVGA